MKRTLSLIAAFALIFTFATQAQMTGTVTLSSMTVTDNGTNCDVAWTTSIQEYVDSFILCRDINGGGYTEEYIVQGVDTYYYSAKSYSFSDPGPFSNGDVVTYILKFRDNFGNKLYVDTVTKTIVMTGILAPVTSYMRFRVYPNQVEENVTVDINLTLEEEWDLLIFDASGRLMEEWTGEGRTTLYLNMLGYESGVYFMSLKQKGTIVETQKVIVN